ncbi:hypothetical protein ABG768_005120 [Culter alburnus]|uniref:Cilia- and flagella-associated protein 36 n=1 Tax=Culter alburnus TaxID=194366 RepID=A0AAW1ZQV5_CULAL
MADDSEWVLESVAGFLSSPDWLIPLAEFMENKCSVFDDEEENKLTYTEIHQQYKQLVERLLETHMQEVGISEQQFLRACSSFSSSRALQAVFQPVLATDDFQMFRSLMVQKNMELQLQALHVIKERNGGLPECLTNGVDVMNELEQQEMKILQEVLRRSKEEYDLEMMAHRTQEKEEPASTSSSLSDTPPGNACEPQTACDSGTRKTSATNGVTEATELKVKQSESAAVKSSATASRKGKALPAVRAPVKGSVSANHKSPEKRRDEDTQRDSRPLADEVALQQRSEYLKQQRDKLQALKRDQTLKSPADAPPAAPEPRASSQEISVEEKKKLQKRKHLAEKLKEEVIKK